MGDKPSQTATSPAAGILNYKEKVSSIGIDGYYRPLRVITLPAVTGGKTQHEREEK